MHSSWFSWNAEKSRNTNSNSFRLRAGWGWVVTVLSRGHLAIVPPPLHLLSYCLDAMGIGLCHQVHTLSPTHTLHFTAVFKIAKQGEANAKDGELHRWHDSEKDLNEFAWDIQGVWTLPEGQSSPGDLSTGPCCWVYWTLQSLTGPVNPLGFLFIFW